MFLLSILKFKDSFFNLAPSQVGQLLIIKKSSAHFLMDSYLLDLWYRSTKFLTPSNRRSYLTPLLSLPALIINLIVLFPVPYMIISKASFGISFIGVDNVKSNFLAIALIC